jgi:hypothetical protein
MFYSKPEFLPDSCSVFVIPAHLEHPAVREWAEALYAERQSLWQERGMGEQAEQELGDVKIGK